MKPARLPQLVKKANAYSARKDYAAAETLYKEIVALAPRDPSHWNEYGIALWYQRRLAEAEALFRHALTLAPNHLHALTNLANLLLESERCAEAASYLGQALAQKPNFAPALLGQANQLNRQGKYEAAVALLEQALATTPEFDELWIKLAALHRDRDQLVPAEYTLRQAIARRGPKVELLLALAATLAKAKRYEEVEALGRHVLLLDPQESDAWINLGYVAMSLHEFENAKNLLRKGLKLDPNNAQAYCNLGSITHQLGQLVEAEQLYANGIANDAQNRLVRFNLATLLLLRGDYQRGWEYYEFRDIEPPKTAKESLLAAPRWDGEAIADRTLLVYHEQGLGDTIQCLRFLAAVRQRCRRLIVWPQEVLLPFFEGFPDIETVSSLPEDFDVCVPFFSLPKILGVSLENLPWETAYLQAEPLRTAHWARWLENHAPHPASRPLRCGIVWAGNQFHANDIHRSLSLASLSAIVQAQGVQWIILQKDGADEAFETCFPPGTINPMPEVKTYADTAAIVASLDLVIAVDTSVAHVAGAMGKPTWILLPANPDWRWAIDFPDSNPWYPSVRLFRQTALGDWSVPIAALRQALSTEFGVTYPAEQATPQEASLNTAQTVRAPVIDIPRNTVQQISNIPFWTHKIRLSKEFETPGWGPINPKAYDFPESLAGKRVLDIGARDGFWTFEALRRGAREVVAIDNFVDRQGVPLDAAYPQWQNFELCRKVLGYSPTVCKNMTMSAYDISEQTLGRFDVILLYGVIHQLRYPQLVLDKIFTLCDDRLLIESPVADDFSPYRGGFGKGYPDGETLLEIYPSGEYLGNPANYCCPTLQALAFMANAAGFVEVDGWKMAEKPTRISECRGFVTAARQRMA